MIRHWWQSTFLLLALFALAACSGAAPDAESTSVEEPSITPSLPTSSPEPSTTPFQTETASLTPTPQPSPTATSEPTPQPTEVPLTPTPRVYNGEMGYINFEPTDPALIEAELSKPEYTNTWPLTKDAAGDYGLTGIITNHQRVNIELPDGHVIKLLSEFYYNDADGNIQHIDIPIYMEDPVSGFSYRSISANFASKSVWSEYELVEGLIKAWYSLDSGGKVIEKAVLDFKRTTNPGWVVEQIGNWEPTIHSDYYLRPILDELGVTPEQIWTFAQIGNPASLAQFEGMRFLIPSVIVSPETN